MNKFFLAILCIVINSIASSQTPNACFNAPNSYNTLTFGTTNHFDLASSDFNEDGYKDMLVVNYGDISILLGNGSGSFSVPVTYSVSGLPVDVVITDFNNDGNVDLAVSNNGSLGNISILFGSGTGSFGAPINYSVTTSTTLGEIDNGDLNNDGVLDLIVACGNNQVAVLIGTLGGTFNSPVFYNVTSGNTKSITIGDFNLDSKLDVAVSHSNSSKKISVLINNGSGGFLPAVTYTVGGQYPRTIVCKDFNNDGKNDLATLCSYPGKVSILLGSGTGTFTPSMDYLTDGDLYTMTVNDFNNDGNFDIAVAIYNAEHISVLLGTGTGTFSLVKNYLTCYRSAYIISEDFNNDGNIDLVTSSPTVPYFDSKIVVLMGYGNGKFSSSETFFIGSLPEQQTAGDFNLDGFLDLAFTRENGSMLGDSVCISFNLGNGQFSPMTYYAIWDVPLDILTSDFNNDAILDLAVLCSKMNSTAVHILLGSSSGTFSVLTNSLTISAWSPPSLVSNDFNGDGKMDLAMSIAGEFDILKGDGSGHFLPMSTYTATTGTFQSITTADFNGDNKPDLAGTDNGTGRVSVLLNSGTGSFLSPVNYNLSYQSIDIVSGDFNNDNAIDLVVTRNDGYISVLLNSGTGTFQPPLNHLFGASFRNVSVVDFNNDSKLDLLASESSSLTAAILSGLGTGSFTQTASYTTGVEVQSTLVRDFNNDGILDFTLAFNSGPVSLYAGYLDGITLYIGGGSLSAITSGTTTICTGATVVLNANPASTYTWSTGATTNSISVTPSSSLNYTVSGVSYAGCPYKTVKTINVNPSPSVSVVSSNSICVGTSASITASGAISYTWNTGATTSSITETPTISTTYSVTGADLNNCSNTQTVSITVDNTCTDVWPGDANSDGIADNLDVLELGLHYTQTGIPRASVSNSWQSYHADNWTGTISNGKNVNHSNCNGDGIINDDDTLAIYNNYGLTHAFKAAETNTINPQLMIVPDQNMVAKGNWGSSSIYLGDAASLINNLNGVAFTAMFDNTLIETDSVYIEYQNSFIGLSTQNLKFRKPDFTNGKIYTAITHTISNNVSGYGKIATLHYKIKSNLAIDAPLSLSLTQANQSDATGAITPLSAGSATLMAIGASVGLNEVNNNNLIAIQPNPSNGLVVISSTTELEKIEVLNLAGQVLVSENANSKTHQLYLENLANGIYFVKVYNSQKQVSLKKLVVQK